MATTRIMPLHGKRQSRFGTGIKQLERKRQILRLG